MVKGYYMILPVCFLLFSCSRSISISDVSGAPSVQLDSTYHYFIREIYRIDSGDVKLLKSEGIAGPNTKATLIEIEYLFISNDGKDNIIYMATIPDRRQKRYSENYLGSEYVNTHDVRIVQFGKISALDKNKFVFSSYKAGNEDEWTVTVHRDAEVFINTIKETKGGEFYNMMLVESALADPVKFKKVNRFNLVYYNPKSKITDTAHVAGNKIYYEKEAKFPVYVYYGRQKDDRYNVKQFRKKRIPYNPEEIFK